MGSIRPLEKAILFAGCLFSDQRAHEEALPGLKEHFGAILYSSPVFPWNHSSYYTKELGSPLLRQFVFFDPLIDTSLLADAKLFTNDIEAHFSRDGRRRINIDPGYLTLAKIVLASTKNYSHRIYLGKGIYGELTLYFMNGRFSPLPFTYHDYQEKECMDIFYHARERLMIKLKG